MDITKRVEAIAEKTLSHMGFEIVRVLLSGRQRPTLQIMIDRADGQNISLDDCVLVSQTVSAMLDVEDPIAGSYLLEVTSPGWERPLTKPAHFKKFVGQYIRIETSRMVEGRRRFLGMLNSANDEAIELVVPNEAGEQVILPFQYVAITKAQLQPDADQEIGKKQKKLKEKA